MSGDTTNDSTTGKNSFVMIIIAVSLVIIAIALAWNFMLQPAMNKTAEVAQTGTEKAAKVITEARGADREGMLASIAELKSSDYKVVGTTDAIHFYPYEAEPGAYYCDVRITRQRENNGEPSTYRFKFLKINSSPPRWNPYFLSQSNQ